MTLLGKKWQSVGQKGKCFSMDIKRFTKQMRERAKDSMEAAQKHQRKYEEQKELVETLERLQESPEFREFNQEYPYASISTGGDEPKMVDGTLVYPVSVTKPLPWEESKITFIGHPTIYVSVFQEFAVEDPRATIRLLSPLEAVQPDGKRIVSYDYADSHGRIIVNHGCHPQDLIEDMVENKTPPELLVKILVAMKEGPLHEIVGEEWLSDFLRLAVAQSKKEAVL